MLNEATKAYDTDKLSDALRLYESVISRPDGQQLRAFNGLYLTNMKLGRADEAEQAFSRIVALGLATNSLSVKFLFRPGMTEFLGDPRISGPYDMWLRLIAKEVAARKSCLTVVGHTSRTGSAQTNDRLSLQRAAVIQRRIETQAPEASAQLQSVGMGFRENMVGSGNDDLRDALDRRVEFKVRSC